MTWPSWNRYPGRSTLALVVVALLLFIVEHINGRFWLNDLRVYYGAAQALLDGERVYGIAHGLDSGVYKYAPVIALLFTPLALLPYWLASPLHYFMIVAAFIGALHNADRLVRDQLLGGRAASYGPVFITAVCVIVHLHRELHLGNINVMLLWLLLFALDRLVRGNALLAGALIGMAIMAKPHFIVLLPLLTIHRQWRPVTAAIAVVVSGFLLPALVLGPSANVVLQGEWLDQMAQHNAELIYTGGSGYEAVNTVYSFFHRSILDRFVGAPTKLEAFLILACIALIFGALILHGIRADRSKSRSFAFAYLLLVALVPCITLTDTEHFILALPIVLYLVHHLIPTSRLRLLPFLAIPILVAYGGNWEDALGPLSGKMVHYGVLGIGTMALLVLVSALYLHEQGSDPMIDDLSDQRAT